jgi:polyhydroxyalkanoate synthesis regulator phasin
MSLNNNESPWAKGAEIDTTVAPSLDALVDRKFATQYLAQRLPMPYGDIRQFRDRIGKKIDTAVKNGKLNATDGQYIFSDLATWARSRRDFAPAVVDILIPTVGHAQMFAPVMFGRAFGYSLPATLPACQAALADAYRELNNLREEVQTLRATVATLTPLKAKAMAISKVAIRSGKQGGRGNKK